MAGYFKTGWAKFALCNCWIAAVNNFNASSSALSLTFLEVLSIGTSNSVLGKCLLRAVSAAVPVVAWPNRIIGIIQLLGQSNSDHQQGSSAFSWAQRALGQPPSVWKGKISNDLLISLLWLVFSVVPDMVFMMLKLFKEVKCWSLRFLVCVFPALGTKENFCKSVTVLEQMSTGVTTSSSQLSPDIVFTPVRVDLRAQNTVVLHCIHKVSPLLADFHLSLAAGAVWTESTAVCFLSLLRWAGREQSLVVFLSEMCIFVGEQAVNGWVHCKGLLCHCSFKTACPVNSMKFVIYK